MRLRTRILSALILPLVCTSALAQERSGGQPDGSDEPQVPEAVPAPLPEGMVARVGDAYITRDEYETYLFDLAGYGPLKDMAYQRLLEAELARLGLEVTQADLDAEWAREELALVARSGGDPQQLARELEQMGYGIEGYKRRFYIGARPKLLEERIILATREPTEEQVQEYFHRVYGEGGVKVQLRHLMLTRSKIRADLRTQRVVEAELTNERLDVELAARARAVLAELQSGKDFESVARRESADLSVHQNGGVIPNYNYRHYGAELASAVRAAAVGVVTGPVQTQAGLHIIRVEERTTTLLEDVRATILAELAAAEATYPERANLKMRLFREHPVQLPE